jgi:pimeloyl-ACP methyl ester carboxylesterase
MTVTERLTKLELDGYGEPAQPTWRDIDWTQHERQIDIDGCRINYVDLGEGEETVLFIHGLGASWRWFLEVMPTIAKNRRVISVDLPCFGASGVPAERTTFRLYARYLDTFCERLGLGRVPVVGHSLGTLVALEFATHHPQRVAKVTLAGGPLLSAGRMLEHPISHGRRNPRLAAALLVETLLVPIPVSNWMTRNIVGKPRWRQAMLGPYPRYATKLPDDLIAQLLIGLGGSGVRAAIRGLFRDSVHHGIDDIACPVLIINGTRDMLQPAADVEEFLHRVPHARATLFAETGHWPQHERPAAFIAELTRFLDEA